MATQPVVYIDLGVGGMTCDDCVVHVTSALSAVPGVRRAQVDSSTGVPSSRPRRMSRPRRSLPRSGPPATTPSSVGVGPLDREELVGAARA